MPEPNTQHIVGFRVPNYNLYDHRQDSVYEFGVFDENVFE